MAHTTHTQPHRPSVTAYRSRSTGGMARIREANSVSPFALTRPQDPSANAPAVFIIPSLEAAGVNYSCSKESGDSVATLVRKPSEDVAAEKKPTPIKRGYWRNRWAKPTSGVVYNEHLCTDLGDGTMLGYGRHPTAEVAEHLALNVVARNPFQKYLGPVFFPADGGAS